MFEFYKSWMEFFFFVLMILGIFIALFAPSAIISYVIIFISGMFAGKMIYERKHKIKFPYVIIIIGFVIGYAIGVYYGSKIIAIVLFIVGYVVGNKLYEKKILRDTRF